MLNGLMNFAGSSIGALMMATVPRGTSAFFFIFGLSTVLRFGVCGALLGHLREVRLAERISYTSLFFRLSTMRSQAGFGLRFFVFPSRRGGARESGSRGPGGSR
jgi:hypothetical protein